MKYNKSTFFQPSDEATSYVLADSDVNANVFVTDAGINFGGNVGVAWLGTVCEDDVKLRSSVSQWLESDLATAEVIFISKFVLITSIVSYFEIL